MIQADGSMEKNRGGNSHRSLESACGRAGAIHNVVDQLVSVIRLGRARRLLTRAFASLRSLRLCVGNFMRTSSFSSANNSGSRYIETLPHQA